uniref:Peptidase M13 N-terminal domain-containing protein n=1 Tax=Globodera rostochiensis TaxID=31243 RepID=A0A914H969_GLORO
MFSKSVVTAFALLTALAFLDLICWADDSALVEVAKTSLPSMESRQDPCQDFYAFACSRNIKWWDGVHPMFKLFNELADENPAKSMTENMLKRAWHICMQENSSNATKIWAKISTKFFDQFGGMPALVGQGWQQSTVKSSQTFWRMIGKLLSETIDPFFIIDAFTVDDPNVRNVFCVKPPKLLVSRQLLLKHELQHMVEESKVRMLQGFSGAYLDKQYLKRSIDDVFEFQRRLAQQILPDVERNINININNTFTLNSLSNAFPSINWTAFFDGFGILELLLESERKSNNSFSLIVPDLNYVGFLNTIFEGQHQQQQQWATNQTVFNLIGTKISFMDNETRGRDSRASLGNCLTQMIEVMPFAIGYSYVKIIENREDIINDVKQLTTFIFEAFAEMLNSTSWATAETKRHAQAKL